MLRQILQKLALNSSKKAKLRNVLNLLIEKLRNLQRKTLYNWEDIVQKLKGSSQNYKQIELSFEQMLDKAKRRFLLALISGGLIGREQKRQSVWKLAINQKKLLCDAVRTWAWKTSKKQCEVIVRDQVIFYSLLNEVLSKNFRLFALKQGKEQAMSNLMQLLRRALQGRLRQWHLNARASTKDQLLGRKS